MIRSGAGLLCIPENPANQEQYQRRREIRRSIMHHYESQNDTELLQEEIDLIDNDPQLQDWVVGIPTSAISLARPLLPFGVLRLPYGGEEREKYLRRLEKRKGLVG